MQYFTYIAWHYAQNNKLDKAVAELLENHNRKIINNEMELSVFKNFISEAIKIFELQNPRCKPLGATWGKLNDHGDNVLFGVHCLTFHIYQAKN